MNLILIGFKRSGKSTVGKHLATRLSRPFIDTDEFITHSYGMSCREIYKKIGDEAFRQLEDEWLARIARCKGSIIALGGGSLRESPILSGAYLYLKLPKEEVKNRLMEPPKPAFFKDFDTHFDERSAIYERYATQSFDPKAEKEILQFARGVFDGSE